MAELTTVYKCTNGTDFPVRWQLPQDGQLNWVRDASHFPYPLTPLAVDFTRRVYENSGYPQYHAWRRGFPTAGHVRTFYPLGFVYRLVTEPAEQDASLQEYGRLVVEMAPDIRRVWKRELEPQIRATCDWLQRGDYLSMDLPQLTTYLEHCMEVAAGAYGLTFVAASPMFACADPLGALCRKELGSAGESTFATLTEGFSNESSASDMALWRLARRARSIPEVAEAFQKTNTEQLLGVLHKVHGREEFLREFNRYLHRYGWRLETWDELSMPTWQESPDLAIRVIEHYVAIETESPRAPLVRSARRRRNVAQQVASSLASQPDKLAQFQTALPMARQFVPVREGRAFWQLTLGGSLRPVCLALGEKLRDVGVLEQTTDVFYLRLEEMHQIAEGARENDWREVAKRRQVEREYWIHMEPPPVVGVPPASQ